MTGKYCLICDSDSTTMIFGLSWCILCWCFQGTDSVSPIVELVFFFQENLVSSLAKNDTQRI